MNDLYTKSIGAGICFAIWPLLLHRSGLNGNVSTAVISILAIAFTLPWVIFERAPQAEVNWRLVIAAGFLGAMGMLLFNKMLAKAPLKDFSTYFVLVLLVQVLIPAIYDTFVNRKVSSDKMIGFILTGIAAFLLTKK